MSKTVTITRRTRNIGYGCTSHVARDGGIQNPKRTLTGLTPRTALAARKQEVISCGGNPNGGCGAYYREGFWIGSDRVALDGSYNKSDLLWDLTLLARGECDSVTVTVKEVP